MRNLFEQVDREQQRRLDVLVNNAYAGVQPILNNSKKSFWENPASIWDDINNVGLSATGWLRTVLRSCGATGSATCLCGRGWCRQSC